MTETLQRPARSTALRGDAPAAPGRRLLVAGALSALWAVAAGLAAVGLPVLLAWATDARAGAGAADALRSVGQIWLVAHGVPLDVPGGVLSLTPLGLLALPVLLLRRAGRALARERGVTGVRAAARAAAAVAVPYAVLAGGVAVASPTAEVATAPVYAVICGLAVAVLGAGLGVLREGGRWGALRSRVPAFVRRQLVAATGALGVLAAGGALLAGGSLAAHLGRAGELTRATSPGVVGALALLLLGLSLVPNAVVWGAAWLAGPGFVVGVGTQVGPFAHELGPVPALPLLAALPGSAVPGRWGLLALLVPLAAGAVAGALVRRRLAGGGLQTAAEAALSGAGAGLLLAALAWLSGGAVGGGRLAAVGPSPVEVGLAVSAEVALTAVVTALVLRRRER
jgi:hypothetical protein